MTKKKLTTIINNSILKNDINTLQLYEKYIPQIINVLKPFAEKTKLPKTDSLRIFCDSGKLDLFLRSNSVEVVEQKLKDMLNELRKWAHNKHPASVSIPDGATQKSMREEVVVRLNNLMKSYNASDKHTATILNRLKKATNDLDGMFLPKSDIRVNFYYDTIMEELDNLNFENQSQCEENMVGEAEEKIINCINEWCSLKR